MMSAPGDEIAGDECAVMSPPMMSCPVTAGENPIQIVQLKSFQIEYSNQRMG